MSETKNDQLAFIIGFGISIGAFAGIIAGIVSEVEISNTLIYGVGGGILTGALVSTFIQRTNVSDNIVKLTALGLGFGTLVGASLGTVAAWSLELSYLGGFSTGAGLGLVFGAVLGLLTGTLSNQSDN